MRSWEEFYKQNLWEREHLTTAEKKAHSKPGGSNVGTERETSGPDEGPFCGPAGGAPAKSFPVTGPGQARSAIGHSGHAPNPEGVKKCAERIAKKHGWFDK